jgi:hypothetical protein
MLYIRSSVLFPPGAVWKYLFLLLENYEIGMKENQNFLQLNPEKGGYKLVKSNYCGMLCCAGSCFFSFIPFWVSNLNLRATTTTIAPCAQWVVVNRTIFEKITTNSKRIVNWDSGLIAEFFLAGN